MIETAEGAFTGPKRLTRKVIRELLALAFWAHALYVLQFLPLPQPPFPSLPRYLFNLLLCVFIINYSFFSSRGWWSVAFDLTYIYFLPFIYVGKLAWWITRTSFRVMKKNAVIRSPKLIVEKAANAVQGDSRTEVTSHDQPNRLWEGSIRAVSKFALLWSLLIMTVDYKPFLLLAVLVTLIGAARSFWVLWELFSGEPRWLSGLEEKLATVIRRQVDLVASWDGVSEPDEIKKQVNSIKLHDSILSFIRDNRSMLSRGAWMISLAVSLPFYGYLSYLFACVYFGIAKVFNLHFSFAYAFLDSLYVPFAWSDLPKNFAIRLIAGLQAICIGAVGWTVFFRHLGTRFEKMAVAAERLHEPFEDQRLRERLVQVQVLLSLETPPEPRTTNR